MTDIAADYADAIRGDLQEPVLLHGISTGAAVALQLAMDHPDLVARLVLAPGACRLSPKGRQAQADLARHSRAGNNRAAWAAVMGLLAPKPALTAPTSGMGWLAGPLIAASDPADLLATVAAEDAFDAEPRLGEVTAPTLVMGGTDDPFYSADLFRRTAEGVANGRLHLFPGKGHMYVATHPLPMAISLGFFLTP